MSAESKLHNRMFMLSTFEHVRVIGTDQQQTALPSSIEAASRIHPLFSSIQVSYESKMRKRTNKGLVIDELRLDVPTMDSTSRRNSAAIRGNPVSHSNIDDEDERDVFSHQFTVEGLRWVYPCCMPYKSFLDEANTRLIAADCCRFNWNITTKEVVYRIFNTFNEARLLKFALTMNALRPQLATSSLQAGMINVIKTIDDAVLLHLNEDNTVHCYKY